MKKFFKLGLLFAISACATTTRESARTINSVGYASTQIETISHFQPKMTTLIFKESFPFSMGRNWERFSAGSSSCKFTSLSPIDPQRRFILPSFTTFVLDQLEFTQPRVEKKFYTDTNVVYTFKTPGSNLTSFALFCSTTTVSREKRLEVGDIQLLLSPIATISSPSLFMKSQVPVDLLKDGESEHGLSDDSSKSDSSQPETDPEE